MSNKISIEDCKYLGIMCGFECISDIYISKTKLEWKCSNGHTWFALYDNIRKGSGCPYCSKRAVLPHEPADYAAKHGGICLSVYKDYKTKMEWECKYRHKWFGSFGSMRSKNNWCPHCSRNARLSIEECGSLAQKHEGVCLSESYVNSISKLEWQCKNGHIFWSTPSRVKHLDNWCPYCFGNAKLTIDDAKYLANLNDGKCLSKEYKNAVSKLSWKCANEHVWDATYACVKKGSWCQECNSISKKQRKLGNIIRSLTNCTIVHNFKGFDWLYADDTNYRLEIDIWVPEIKLGIEYDGEQHFKPIAFGGQDEYSANIGFERTKKLDIIKNKKISEHKSEVNSFVRFTCYDKIIEQQVKDKLLKNGVC